MYYMFLTRLLTFILFSLLNTINSVKQPHPQPSFHLFKESILHKQSLVQNEGLDIRKNNSFQNDFVEQEQIILIAKYIEKKKLLEFLLNKDISLHSKIEKIEKCNELLMDDFDSKRIQGPSLNLGLKKDFDEFLSS